MLSMPEKNTKTVMYNVLVLFLLSRHDEIWKTVCINIDYETKMSAGTSLYYLKKVSSKFCCFKTKLHNFDVVDLLYNKLK